MFIRGRTFFSITYRDSERLGAVRGPWHTLAGRYFARPISEPDARALGMGLDYACPGTAHSRPVATFFLRTPQIPDRTL